MPVRLSTAQHVEAIATKALLEGYGRVVPYDRSWDPCYGKPRRLVLCELAMDCERPRTFAIYGREEQARPGRRIRSIAVVLSVRCRRCEWCRKMRQRFWVGRAMAEFEAAPRTYMGTLTASIEEHYVLDTAARIRHAKHGDDFDGLSSAKKFEARCIELGAHVTLWIKRLRERGAEFRYLMIAEAHNSERTNTDMIDRPHVHMLIHERWCGSFGGVPERFGGKLMLPDKAMPRANWPLGFTRFEMCESAKPAVYLCKYLVKSAQVRIRNSQRYGTPPGGYYMTTLSDNGKLTGLECASFAPSPNSL